jgi:HAD superfamily hydrolase (TIGR01484 family)
MPPLIMFDLDQTLTESKQDLTPHMADLLARLLEKTRVAVISGGGLPQFLRQVVDKLPENARLENLFLLPTSGAALYAWKGVVWEKIYEELLTKEDVKRITLAIQDVARETRLIDFSTLAHGERIENRGSQVSVSALGQKAPIEEKKLWDPDKSKRKILQKKLEERLPDLAVGMGGATTIDVTKKGVDKAYGIEKIAEFLSIPISEMMYVGDQLEPGGNDAPAMRTSIRLHPVKDPGDTAFFIHSLLS